MRWEIEKLYIVLSTCMWPERMKDRSLVKSQWSSSSMLTVPQGYLLPLTILPSSSSTRTLLPTTANGSERSWLSKSLISLSSSWFLT